MDEAIGKMDHTNQAICDKFGIRDGDESPPFVGFAGDNNRETLAKLFGELGFNSGAEIGVEKGHYSLCLCMANPNLKLKCIDPWLPFQAMAMTRTEAESEKCYQSTIKRLSSYNVEIIRAKSLDAVKQIEDGSLDFVYIDGLHEFDGIMLDLITWVPKVRHGGIVAGHDFVGFYQCAVQRAVYAYTAAHNITRWYVTRDRYPSFFWVNHQPKPYNVW